MVITGSCVHGAKKYENADINDKTKKSYLPYDSYHRVPFESSRVHSGTGEVAAAGGAQRVRSVLSKSHAQSMHGKKKMWKSSKKQSAN
jgi:hypothetical protein